MNEATLNKIIAELETELTGKEFGKIFMLSRYRLAIDFRLAGSRYLLISVEPAASRVHLITRRLRDLTESSQNSSPFIGLLRNRLSNATVRSVAKVPDDRIVRFKLAARDDIGQSRTYFLTAQLTGRSANLFLLDEHDVILDSIRRTSGPGQEIAARYSPPERRSGSPVEAETGIFPQGDFKTLSAALDASYAEREAEERFQAKVKSARNNVDRETAKRKRLVRNLKQDLDDHGNADNWKRSGDLLLANLGNAKRSGTTVSVIDYFAEDTPAIDIEIDENESLPEAAARFFKLYAKARNARTEISARIETVNQELCELELRKRKLEQAATERDESSLAEIAGAAAEIPSPAAKKVKAKFSGARRFISSDGFEILVGRRAKDNDRLTFRIAGSLDLWLHAADYPGSHVIIRNPGRRPVPQTTMIEAARIAAFYSQARSQLKAAVHYTQKKFVNKPKSSASGLVSLASFKTILVEPGFSEGVRQSDKL